MALSFCVWLNSLINYQQEISFVYNNLYQQWKISASLFVLGHFLIKSFKKKHLKKKTLKRGTEQTKIMSSQVKKT